MINIFNTDCFDYLKTLESNSVDLILTDPPYGLLKHKIETDLDIPALFKECYRVLKPNSFIAFCGRQPTLTTWNAEALKLFNYKQEIIWYKRQRSSPMGDMGRMFENIMVCVKPNIKGSIRQFNKIYRPYSDVKQSLCDFSEYDSIFRFLNAVKSIFKTPIKYEDAVKFLNSCDLSLVYKTEKHKGNSVAVLSSGIKQKSSHLSTIQMAVHGMSPQNVVSFLPHNKMGFDMSGEGKGEFNIKHPTVKPIALFEYLIELMSNEGDVVLDPFMGSGTTIIAAQNLKRSALGCELFKEYFDIASDRIYH